MLGRLPFSARIVVLSGVDSQIVFPDPRCADEDGLVAIGGDLAPSTLLNAYRQGIFPWSVRPITWWSPDPRAIIPFDEFHLPRRVARVLRSGVFSTTIDQAFHRVMAGCAAPGPGRESTWISGEFLAAYQKLHHLGHAHSVETWQNGKLVGGVYGVSMGGLFAGESMFYRVPYASMAALVRLMEHLRESNFVLFDTQVLTPHTAKLGARLVPRDVYLDLVRQALLRPCRFS
jgi:leucyl/phenylalanyl-tRNA---protein transferase